MKFFLDYEVSNISDRKFIMTLFPGGVDWKWHKFCLLFIMSITHSFKIQYLNSKSSLNFKIDYKHPGHPRLPRNSRIEIAENALFIDSGISFPWKPYHFLPNGIYDPDCVDKLRVWHSTCETDTDSGRSGKKKSREK